MPTSLAHPAFLAGSVGVVAALLVAVGLLARRNRKKECELSKQRRLLLLPTANPTARRQVSDVRRDAIRQGLARQELALSRKAGAQMAPMPPVYWSMKHLKHNLRRVDVTREMRQHVQDLADATCNANTLGQGRDAAPWGRYERLVVHRVTRIENPAAWRMYVAKRAALRDQLRQSQPVPREVVQTTSASWLPACEVEVNEAFLWHGTKPAVADVILEHGFDERVGSLQGMFGAGVYFADMCSKSDQYCTPRNPATSGSDARFTMFLSRVMLGAAHSTATAMSQTRRPPNMPSMPGRAHDSIVYRPPAGRYPEFIVYDKNQAYPEFLVEFERALAPPPRTRRSWRFWRR